MKIIILTFILILTACGATPSEPVAVDYCVDTFGPDGGRTFTFSEGDSIFFPPWQKPVTLADSLAEATE